MGKLEKFITMVSHIFTEPLCDVHVPWELPVPLWLLGLMLLYELLRGSIGSPQQFLWIVVQLGIASRMELLLIALIVPFVIGKYPTWCKSAEYLYGLAVFLVRLSYMIVDVLVQLRGLSPECVRRLEAVTNRRVVA